MYAATGVGYAASATLAGAVQSAASPSVAILTGTGLTLLLTAASALGELAPQRVNGHIPAAQAGFLTRTASHPDTIKG